MSDDSVKRNEAIKGSDKSKIKGTPKVDQPEMLHSARLKSFVRNMAIIARKHKEREEARAELEAQIERVKRFAAKKKDIDLELKDLDKKVSKVLEKEAKLLGVQRGERYAAREIIDNVTDNREKIKRINDTMALIHKKLDSYVKYKTARQARIDELETRIKEKFYKKKNVAMLRNKLKRAEIQLKRLKKKGADVSRLGQKIENLKARL
jgi:DNA repair exonuclease SbcCD ATPase subunit